jgi:hypothetical protein
MISILFTLLELVDAQFLRLLWVLFIDYLIATGYLLPEQRTVWVDGFVHIIGAAGADCSDRYLVPSFT